MEALVHISGLCFGYPGHPDLIKNLEFTLNPSEAVFIKGESGSGKSTFLRIVNRLVEPLEGELYFSGKPYHEYSVPELRKHIQLVSQVPVMLPGTVMDNLALAAKPGTLEELPRLLEAFNLPEGILEKNGGNVSVGQAQRLCVIRALLLKPDVLLLDEPTASLDPENSRRFREEFSRLRQNLGVALVWVTHEESSWEKEEGRHLYMEGGRFGN